MDLKGFLRDYKISQNEISVLFNCGAPNVSNIVNGKRALTGLQIRLLIEKYGFEAIAKYAEAEELPSVVTVNAQHVQTNSGQINGGGGNTQNVTSAPDDLFVVLKQQSNQITTLLEHQARLIALLEANTKKL